eukprot:CAMPEP_0119523792 /NCGR_PEP_ID=MMETSP1344-20130328/38790_1 /TAXON_ID=236787 /ORGANISM="Florenciella parvula, Strain CCMP2471" /LENGTH=442 /DNA_ID=CAMNT_0007562119 /DNA_START=107 /DNA_END=1435 /DNA_ORIENTATION=+
MLGRSTLLLTLVTTAHGFTARVSSPSRRATLSMVEPINSGYSGGRYGGTSSYANQKNYGGVGREERLNRRFDNTMGRAGRQGDYDVGPRSTSIFGGNFGDQDDDRWGSGFGGFGNGFGNRQRPRSFNRGAPRMSYDGGYGGGGGYGNNNYNGIDSDRRSRSPGLRNNFYDSPVGDFKQPYGGQRSGSFDRGMGSSLDMYDEPYDSGLSRSRGGGYGRRPNWLRGRGRGRNRDLNGDLRRAATRAWQPTAVYGLIMAVMFTFVADNILRVPIMKATPMFFRPLTSVFCHANNAHLYGNAFLLLLFGRRVEEDLGWGGLLVAFLFCGVVANLASHFILPYNTVSLGASGAVFGLFTVSIMNRLSSWADFEWRRLIEVLIIGEFRLIEMVTFNNAGAVPLLVTHLAGVGSGIAFVLLLRTRFVREIWQNVQFNGSRRRGRYLPDY